ncbi:MAG: hypothetical protein QOG08_43, partial [Chloroflexota bacterium]|nr:hypothetical protein [Chloroflexota bacterium]
MIGSERDKVMAGGTPPNPAALARDGSISDFML